MLTRREFGLLAVAGLVRLKPDATYDGIAAYEGISSTVSGVRFGVQTYSFRDLPRPAGAADAIDVVVKAMTDAGLSECELYAPQAEPAGLTREQLRRWRLDTPLDHFRGIKRKFDAAGIAIYAYNYSPNGTFTDDEIARGFEMAKALGAEIITASTRLDIAPRIAPFADRHKMVVAMHNHSNLKDANEFATPDSFAAALKMSKFFKINLDIAHFTAANFDAVAFIRERHADITNLHLKDRKRNQGDNVPWGEGDTPIREVLQLLKRERWPIRAYIEYEHKGAGTPMEEVKKCYQYARQALA